MWETGTATPGADEWYTPPSIFVALGLRFDLDPAAPPGGVPWVPADRHYALPEENGLWLPWRGRVWLNPPYGKDGPAFVERMCQHRHGLALVASRTETRWYQAAAADADAVLLVAGRIAFVPGGNRTPVAEERTAGPRHASHGSTIMAWGADCAQALERAGLGVCLRRA